MSRGPNRPSDLLLRMIWKEAPYLDTSAEKFIEPVTSAPISSKSEPHCRVNGFLRRTIIGPIAKAELSPRLIVCESKQRIISIFFRNAGCDSDPTVAEGLEAGRNGIISGRRWPLPQYEPMHP